MKVDEPLRSIRPDEPGPVPTYAKDNFALTAEALRAAWQPGAKILMLNLPCNPTGGTCDRVQLEAVAGAALRDPHNPGIVVAWPGYRPGSSRVRSPPRNAIVLLWNISSP